MRLLIVGGTSSLAQALMPALSEFAEVITAGRTGCDLHLDLSDPIEKVVFPQNIDAVINTAAHFGGKEYNEILQAEIVNVLGVMNLCNACATSGVKSFVHISSIFSCLDKNSDFYNIYSLSKRHSEEIAQLCCTMYKVSLTVLRPSQLYGHSEAFRKHQPFFFSIIDKAENNEDILIYGSNDALRNFIHVEDMANIIAKVIKSRIKGIYSCLNPNNISYSEIANAAISAFSSKSAIKFMKEKPDIPNNIFELNDTLYRLISYYPQINISLGMEKEALYRKAKL